MKTASLVHFYFGEQSYLRRLAQETVPVGKALEGYDRSVLLHHETAAGPFEVSAVDEKHATVVDLPTADNLVRQINDLGAQGYVVDLYVFAHGWPGHFLTSTGTYGENGTIDSGRLVREVKPLGLRAVWQCNCYGASMNATWRNLGAKVSAGSRYVDFYPTRFTGFIDAWRAGMPFGTAVSSSDTAEIRTPVQAFMLIDAMSRTEAWGGTLLTATSVLGRNDAAQWYFDTCWFRDGEYDTTKTGKQNMNYASTMLIDGDRKVSR